jgi:uncharacterized protein (TIGR03032 family)
MSSPTPQELDALWARHSAEWRDTAQITSQWQDAAQLDPDLLKFRVRGDFWGTLAECNISLLVTREYEHLVMALQMRDGAPHVTFMKMPHPSGIAVNRERGIVHIASTRNPNQVYDLMPARSLIPRADMPQEPLDSQPLVPVGSRFYPGCTYMHEIALIGGELYANSVGQNAVVRLGEGGSFEYVWYPRCIEGENGPIFAQNHIQLNSIAAGDDLSHSFFSASSDEVSSRRPGHRNYPVDGRGVIFSGQTREAIARGLTRPHSARLHQGKIWVDNSGYGQLVVAEDGGMTPVIDLPGWTRGLCFYENIAFVGTSRVIPRFRQYAPGLDVDGSICGIHAIDTRTGELLGSLIYPLGNQIFAVEWLPLEMTTGFAFSSRRATAQQKKLFYAFSTSPED